MLLTSSYLSYLFRVSKAHLVERTRFLFERLRSPKFKKRVIKSSIIIPPNTFARVFATSKDKFILAFQRRIKVFVITLRPLLLTNSKGDIWRRSSLPQSVDPWFLIQFVIEPLLQNFTTQFLFTNEAFQCRMSTSYVQAVASWNNELTWHGNNGLRRVYWFIIKKNVQVLKKDVKKLWTRLALLLVYLFVYPCMV